jgi:hypothetical protein
MAGLLTVAAPGCEDGWNRIAYAIEAGALGRNGWPKLDRSVITNKAPRIPTISLFASTLVYEGAWGPEK